MLLVIVGVFDQALGAFARPAFVPSVGVALRGFSDEVNRPDSEMGKHPNDYSLFRLGTFDDDTGAFVNDSERLALASQVLVKE
ncbi:MAG: nonstructural protein [Microvirus sp.]|nr:MAG: nonstructural protein [Microvirus sp.]